MLRSKLFMFTGFSKRTINMDKQYRRSSKNSTEVGHTNRFISISASNVWRLKTEVGRLTATEDEEVNKITKCHSYRKEVEGIEDLRQSWMYVLKTQSYHTEKRPSPLYWENAELILLKRPEISVLKKHEVNPIEKYKII